MPSRCPPRRSDDQTRLLIIYILCAKSVDEKFRNKLLASGHLTPRQQTAVLNLVNLHVPTARKVRGRHNARVTAHRRRVALRRAALQVMPL